MLQSDIYVAMYSCATLHATKHRPQPKSEYTWYEVYQFKASQLRWATAVYKELQAKAREYRSEPWPDGIITWGARMSERYPDGNIALGHKSIKDMRHEPMPVQYKRATRFDDK